MMSESSGWEYTYGQNIVCDKDVDTLKSMGCVFYLPLTSQYATTDLVNGGSMETSTYSGYTSTFDSSKNMWNFKISSSASIGYWASRIKTNWTSGMFLSNSLSTICKLEMVIPASQKYPQNILLGPSSPLSKISTYENALLNCPYNNSTDTNQWLTYANNPDIFCHTVSSIGQYYYSKGKFGNISNTNTSYRLPNYFLSKYDGNMYFGGTIEHWQQGTEYWMSDIMVFNKKLTSEEIQSLFTTVDVLLYKRRMKSLSITANDVPGRKTNTTINYTATWEYKYEDGTREEKIENGTTTSEEFPQNTSYTDTVQRTIKFTLGGKTAETTITQGIWTNQEYTINLNSQWQKSSETNPDSSLYDGVYESYSNKDVHNSGASMYITINGYSNFKLYIRSDAERLYDYVMVSQLDKTLTYNSSYSDTSLVKSHTRDSQNSGTSIGSYKLVEFTNIDEGEHTIQIIYCKDSSYSNGKDCGYVLIPKDQ